MNKPTRPDSAPKRGVVSRRSFETLVEPISLAIGSGNIGRTWGLLKLVIVVIRVTHHHHRVDHDRVEAHVFIDKVLAVIPIGIVPPPAILGVCDLCANIALPIVIAGNDVKRRRFQYRAVVDIHGRLFKAARQVGAVYVARVEIVCDAVQFTNRDTRGMSATEMTGQQGRQIRGEGATRPPIVWF